jgi:hypothetical protein
LNQVAKPPPQANKPKKEQKSTSRKRRKKKRTGDLVMVMKLWLWIGIDVNCVFVYVNICKAWRFPTRKPSLADTALIKKEGITNLYIMYRMVIKKRKM